MKRIAIFALLALPISASAQGPLTITPSTSGDLVNHPPSQADVEMQAELARHPGQHWVCEAADWYCLQGHWEANLTPQQYQSQREEATRAELKAMQDADQAKH